MTGNTEARVHQELGYGFAHYRARSTSCGVNAIEPKQRRRARTDDLFEKGLEKRRQVLGAKYVDAKPLKGDEDKTLTATKPWEKMKPRLSRATYYRRLKSAER
jgi:hypothetical protein